VTSKQVQDQATYLYFDIEEHVYTGGGPLTIREVGRMLGVENAATSTGKAKFYIDLLKRWGLIQSSPNTIRTIVLAPRNYPPVEYRKGGK